MPYKCEKIKLSETQDRRTKLTAAQREEIAEKYATGNYSQRQLARDYSVSRRLITFIIDPEKKRRDLENRAARGGSKQYYNREKHRETMKAHRRYKHGLYKAGELTAAQGQEQ